MTLKCMSNLFTSLDFDTFGELLRHLRRRAQLTQRDLGLAVGYSETHITRLENGQRLPDLIAVKGSFVEALDLKREPELAKRLIELATKARGGTLLVPKEREASARTNLPVQLTSFVGREQEIAEVKELLGTTRLLTLIGAGGVGKTRLAQEAASSLRNTFTDEVWFVGLAALTDSALVPQAIAATLKLIEQPGRTPLEIITDYFEAKPALLILDNCEHLIQACAELAETLLSRCAQLRFLATSREPLQIVGEASYRVPSLAVPQLSKTSPEQLLTHASVRLFVDRAQFAQPRFRLTAKDAPAMTEICKQLDGIALAIELAAALTKTMSVTELSRQLKAHLLSLLTSGRRTLSRHQTMRNTLDWSYSLLTSEEQRLLAQLSVFAGGWTADEAEAVCDGEVLPLLLQLVNKSLVVVEQFDDVTRYHLLEPTRQYASEKLHELGNADDVRHKHALAYLRLAEFAGPQLHNQTQIAWLDRLERELDNLRAALTWALEHDLTYMALRIIHNSYPCWNAHGHLVEARQWYAKALSAIQPESLPVEQLIEFLTVSGLVALDQRDYIQARNNGEQLLGISQKSEDGIGIAQALGLMGGASLGLHEFDAARTYLTENLQLCRQMKHELGECSVLDAIGHLERSQHNLDIARAYFEQSLEIARRTGDVNSITSRLISLGLVFNDQLAYGQALECLREALDCTTQTKNLGAMYECIAGLASVETSSGRYEEAAEFFGLAETLRRKANYAGFSVDSIGFERIEAIARRQLGEAAFAEAFACGQAMSMDEARDSVVKKEIKR